MLTGMITRWFPPTRLCVPRRWSRWWWKRAWWIAQRSMHWWIREIAGDQGVQPFPDTGVSARAPKLQHVYSVRFAAQELWGADASARDSVYLDLWEDYLEPA